MFAGVIYVACDNKQPVRYLVTLNKQDKVLQLKSELRLLIGEDESCDLVIAEVFNRHVSRILVRHNVVRFHRLIRLLAFFASSLC